MQDVETVQGGAPDNDLHASKISPDDPRLRIERPKSRTLKQRPIVAAVTVLVGAAIYAITSSLSQSNQKGMAVSQEPLPSIPTPALPSVIRDAPTRPEGVPTDVSPLPGDFFAEGERVPFSPPSTVGPLAPDPQVQLQRQQEAERDSRAASAGVLFDLGTPGADRRPSYGADSNPAHGQGFMTPRDPNQLGAPTEAGQLAFDPNFQTRKNDFLNRPNLNPDYLPTTIERPRSPYELKATTIIPAVLITGINSDLPGPIIAQVRERVYDTVSGQHLLIPQGARLLAAYDSMVAWGQERVLMCWNRLILPNGDSINLQCMPAADLKGQAGLTDEVDEHWDRLLAAAGLSTVLSLGVQGAVGNTQGFNPTLPQMAARNAAEQVNNIGQQVVGRSLMIQPTITVRPGFAVNVIVTKDMILEPYSGVARAIR